MLPTIVRNKKEIEAQLNLAEETKDQSRYFGMSYEQGMIAMYEWLTGETDSLPIEED